MVCLCVVRAKDFTLKRVFHFFAQSKIEKLHSQFNCQAIYVKTKFKQV